MSAPLPESAAVERPPVAEQRHRSRSSAEQLALAEAWQAVDNAIRSIFELARSLEFLSDAIQRVEAEPVLEFREVENGRNRFRLE